MFDFWTPVNKFFDQFLGAKVGLVIKISLMWLINAAAIFIPIHFLGSNLPDRLNWISQNAIAISVILGIFDTAVCVLNNHDIKESQVVSTKLSVVIFFLIALLALFATFTPDQTSEITELKEQLQQSTRNLSDAQIARIEQLIKEKGLISQDDIKQLNLNDIQTVQVIKILEEHNYVKKEDVVSIIKTYEVDQTTAVAAATATAQFSTCYIEILPGYSSVGIHKLPQVKSEAIDYMTKNDRFVVIGHNGGSMNQDRLWLVIIHEEENQTVYGWISSSSVTEINEPACVLLKKWPGS